MAANFGDTIFEGEIAPSVQQQAPVEDRSGLYLAEAANSFATGIGEIGGSIWKNNQENEANGVLVRYRQDALVIADAMEQGLSPQAGRMRLRALYGDYLSNNPSLAEDIDKVNSTILSDNGLANIIKSGNEEAQRQEALADSAYAAGWGGNTGGYTNFMNATRALETEQKEIAAKQARLGYASALDQQTLKDSVNRWASAGMPWVEQQISSASELLDSGADPTTVITQLRTDVGKVIGDLTMNSGGMDIAHITGPVEKRMQLFEEAATGKISTEILTAKLAGVAAQQKYALLMNNPELSNLVAMSELFGAGGATFINNELTKHSVEIMAGLTRTYDPASDTNARPPDLVGVDGEVEAALNSMEEMLTSAADTPSPEKTAEINNVLVNTLRSLKTYNGDSVKDYRQVIDFLSKPAVGRWVDNGQLVVPAELSDTARKVVEAQYEDVLLPLVQEQWDGVEMSLLNTVGSAAPTTDGGPNSFIEPVWDGASVSFRAKAGIESLSMLARTNIADTVKSLNEGENAISGPLNTLIRAKAHMNGSTDYNKEWEFFKERLFPEPVAGETGGEGSALNYAPTPQEDPNAAVSAIAGATFNPLDTAASDVSMADFNEDIEAVYQTVEQTAAVDPQGMANASSPIEAARAYLGMSENNAEQNRTLAAFIKSSAGTEIDPAKTAWCAAFVDAILHSTGSEGTGMLNARSYLDWGKPVRDPQPGDVVVLWRESPDSWKGHVGFYMGTNADGSVKILGGNQGNSVSEENYSMSEVLGFRRAA